MQGLYFIICIAIVIGAIYGMVKRKSSRKKRNEETNVYLSGNQSTPDLDKPCLIQVYRDNHDAENQRVRQLTYYFSLNGSEKQLVPDGGSIEFQTLSKRNVLDGFGGGNGFGGSRLGMAEDSYCFDATSGELIRLICKPSAVFRAGLAGFTETTWRSNISDNKN